MTVSKTFTANQLVAMKAAEEKGGAWYAPVPKMGGAYRRMCLDLVERGFLVENAPFPLTDAGRRALSDHRKALQTAAYIRGEAWAVLAVLAERQASV